MRTFYLYNMNDFCKNIYKQYPYKLYLILKDIYYTSKYNLTLASSSYEEITDKFQKQFLHDYIFNNHKLNHYYHLKNNAHSITNSNEYSQLLVSIYSLKLKTNIKYPKFFNTLNNYSDNIFICDFENNDYFWLKKIIKE